MPTTIHSAASGLYQAQPGEDQLPLYIGVPILLALSLALWTVISAAAWLLVNVLPYG